MKGREVRQHTDDVRAATCRGTGSRRGRRSTCMVVRDHPRRCRSTAPSSRTTSRGRPPESSPNKQAVTYAAAASRPSKNVDFVIDEKHSVIVRPLSNVEYRSVAFFTVDCGLTNLIHDCCSCTLWSCLTGMQRHPYLGFHAWLDVNKPGANGRVSYDSLTHSRLYCRDKEKK